jgi:diguanylate cyclase (GGDEF) domain
VIGVINLSNRKWSNYFKKKLNRLPFKISLLYFMISFIWILFSDRLVQTVFKNSDLQLIANTIKGWVYVIIITGILYYLLNRSFNRIDAAEAKLRKNYRDLSKAHDELETANKHLASSEVSLLQNHEELTALYEELAASDDELKKQFDQMQVLAYNDSITGLPNRLHLQEKIMELINNSSGSVALLFIDLDNFKNINDSFGHSFGDAILMKIGELLNKFENESTFVARLGGDEFAIIVTNKKIEQVIEFAENIITNLNTNINRNDITVHISSSMGIAVYPDHVNSYEDLLKSADTAMYEAKKQGKNQFIIFDHSMNQKIYSKYAMESNLRLALDNNELMLYYQPLYCMKNNQILGFEALIRWNSPIYGMVSPVQFIPLAEETGLILPIGNWVLDTACKFINRINQSDGKKKTVSVNISVYQLAQDNFVEDTLRIISDNNLNPKYITLEITESILIEDVEKNLAKIKLLQKNGIRVAIDDFGTGYSSLNYLKALPIAILKLDKTFIDDITKSKIDHDIVKGIILLANSLDLTIVAEGVEDKEQFDCLNRIGCHIIQGYYISRPLPEDQITLLLKE